MNLCITKISELTDHHFENLESLLEGTKKLQTLSKASSGIGTSVSAVTSILDRLQSNFLGRTILARHPAMNLLSNQVGNIKVTSQSFNVPVSVIRAELPTIIEDLSTIKEGSEYVVGLSGKIYAVQSVLPQLCKQLDNYIKLTQALIKTSHGVRNGFDKIRSARGIGNMAGKLESALGTMENNLSSKQASKLELLHTIKETTNWLTSFQKNIKQEITGSLPCQFIISKGLFSKTEVCSEPVLWYDD